LREAVGQRGQGGSTLGQLDEIGRQLRNRVEPLARRVGSLSQRGQRGNEVLASRALVPAQLERAAQVAQRPRRGQAQLARRLLDGGTQLLPLGQATRLLQAHGEQVAREVE